MRYPSAMHEWSLVQALIERVEDEALARSAVRIARLEIRVGELAGVDADLFAKAFEMFREKTLCENAVLDHDARARPLGLPRVPARIRGRRSPAL